MTAEFTAPDIHCQKCAARVRDALNKQAGVTNIQVDPVSHRVTVEFDESRLTRDVLKTALTSAGYPPAD